MKTKSLLFIIFFAYIALFRAYPQMDNTNDILVYFTDGIHTESIMEKGQVLTKARITHARIKSALSAISVSEDSVIPAFSHFNRADTLRILSDGRNVSQADLSKLYKIRLAKGENTKKIIEYLNNLPEVLYAEPDGIVQPCITPNDTHYNLRQWNMNNPLNPGRDIHAEAAWNIYTGNPDNIIAIVDGGVFTNHEDLNDKITGGDIGTGSDNWISHGTHVAGIAAAESNNGQGVSGVDWNARIHPQRIDLGGDAETYQAIVDAVNYSPNVFVLNNSYGLMFAENTPGRYSTTVRQAVAYAYKNNRIFVASMGNHQNTHPGIVNYPAGYPNTIAVGSTDRNDVIAGSSVHGAYIDVCAPGVGIYSTITGSAYDYMSGTSMAAPHVAGLASLLKGYKTNLANDDVMNIIRLSADDQGDMGFDTIYGYGRINAERELNYLKAPYLLVQATATGGTVTNTSETYKQQFIGANGLTGVYLVKRIEVRKTIPLPDNIYGIVGIWGRGAFSTGWNHENPIFGEGFCEVVPGSQTSTNVTLRTFTYQVYNLLGQYFGYYPQSPSNMTFAYSVLGLGAPSISGPSTICYQANYTIENLPAGATVQWSAGNNITRVSPQGANPCTFSDNRSDTGWIECAVTGINRDTVTLTRNSLWVGIPTNNNIQFGVFFQPPPNDKVPVSQGAYIGVGSNPDAARQMVTGYVWEFMSWSP